jgi:hypothetical protein
MTAVAGRSTTSCRIGAPLTLAASPATLRAGKGFDERGRDARRGVYIIEELALEESVGATGSPVRPVAVVST